MTCRRALEPRRIWRFAPLTLLWGLGLGCALAPREGTVPPELPRAFEFEELVARLQDVRLDYDEASEAGSPEAQARTASLLADAVELTSSLGEEAERYRARMAALQAQVLDGEYRAAVSSEIVRLINDLILDRRLRRSPARPPDLALGARRYGESCGACHGATGAPDPSRVGHLDPAPVDFHESDQVNGLTPYRAYLAVTHGIHGTSMPAFTSLSPEERWAVAFYVMTLRQPACAAARPLPDLTLLANASDNYLVSMFGEPALACLRRLN